MNDLAIRVAELCPDKFMIRPGSFVQRMVYWNIHGEQGQAVDPTRDLNAMHEAESAAFTDDDPLLLNQWAYECYMIGRANAEDKDVSMLRLTAPQRAEAFVKTMEARSVGRGTENQPVALGSPKSASSSGSASMEGANK